jgi:hypothetical protein
VKGFAVVWAAATAARAAATKVEMKRILMM